MLLDGFSRGPSARTLAPAPVKPVGTRACPVRSRRVARLAHCPQCAPASGGDIWAGRQPFLAERVGSVLVQHSARVRGRGAVLPDGCQPTLAASCFLTCAADGLVSAVPSGNRTVGTVWLPPFTDITNSA